MRRAWVVLLVLGLSFGIAAPTDAAPRLLASNSLAEASDYAYDLSPGRAVAESADVGVGDAQIVRAAVGVSGSIVLAPTAGYVYDSSRDVVAPRPGGQRIALGLGDDLDDFAGAQGAITYRDFPGGTGRFADDFVDFAGNPNNEVLFNLDGVRSPWSSVQRAGDLALDEAMRAGASITDWELGQIYRNNWTHVQFFEGGVPVPSPFGG